MDTTQAPVIVDQGNRVVRYWISGNFAPGDVSALFVPGGPPLVATLGTASGATTPFMLDQGPQTIDITFPVASGFVLDPVTISAAGQFTLSGAGLGTLTINPNIAPVVLSDGITVRYAVSGTFDSAVGGEVDVVFNRGTWSVRPSGGGASTTDPGTGTTTTVLGTVTPGVIPSFVVEGEAIAVTFPVPSGAQIDPSSLVDFTQVTLGGAGLNTVTIDHSYAPQLQPDGVTVQYRISGTFGSGDVTASFTPGSWTYVDPGAAVAVEHARPRRSLDADAARLRRRRLQADLGQRHDDHEHDHERRAVDRRRRSGRRLDLVARAGSPVERQLPLLPRRHVHAGHGHDHVQRRHLHGQRRLFERALDRVVHGARPDRQPRRPAGGSVVGVNGLNTAGYIDVPFTAPGGLTLDPSTITDADAEFTISGATGFSIDTTKAPVFVGNDGPNTSIYRYWTTGAYTTGTVQITFIADSYGFTDGSTNTFTGPVAPENFTVDGVATPNIHYVDVQLTPTNGDSLDLASIDRHDGRSSR